jgi:serine/threonine protein kinase
MEYIPGGDLGTLIHHSGHQPEADVKVMASQLLSALKYLHGMQITHRDVKPDNILIYTASPLHVKLTDFGLSKMVDSEETFLRTFCGTLLYCAPEVYSEYREYDHAGRRNPRGVAKRALPPQRYDDAVDIWSLAGVLFYALCGKPPYPVKNGTTYQELLNHIMTQPLDIRPLQLAGVSNSGIRFVRSMLHTRPEHRATIIELENASWLGGSDSVEMSIEDDEVDMVGDGCINPQLQDGASQLSIQDEDFRRIDDSQGDGGLHSVSDLTEIQQREIPSSFNTDDNSNSSYGFPSVPANGGNGRLFGEVNIAALGSSGAIPLDHLPIPKVNHHNAPSEPAFSQESMFTQSEPSNDSPRIENGSQHPRSAAVTMAMPPPPAPANETKTPNTNDIDERATRSSSLMGAESLVGHLNMHSPASTTSPSADVYAPPATNIQDATVSLRRPREDDEEEHDDQPWRPSDLPPKKRRRSEREIDVVVPPSVFWDPKDRSTHHNNYPTMSVSDLNHYHKYAEGKGELFQHGQKTFVTTMQSFRSSRSPSLEPEAARARSEPIRDDGRRIMMKRDERKLDERLVERINAIEPQLLPNRDSRLPVTQRGSNEPVQPTIENDNTTGNNPISASQPTDANDFQPPKRILAKVLATPDSCLPTLSLNITDNLTSWGRGFRNTIRFSNGNETRFPKYAFKVLLFQPNIYTSGDKPDTNDQQMTFYISSKATYGIKINNVPLPSADHQEPQTPSKFWAELRHGDILTVWWHDAKPEKIFTRFKFECYWGKSKEPRKADEPFHFLPEGELLNEIESVCLAQEKAMLTEMERREEKDRKMREQEKQAWKSEAPRQVDVNQSFSGRPASAH